MAAMSRQLAASVGVPGGEYSVVMPLGMTVATATTVSAAVASVDYKSDSGSSQENVDPESQDTGLSCRRPEAMQSTNVTHPHHSITGNGINTHSCEHTPTQPLMIKGATELQLQCY